MLTKEEEILLKRLAPAPNCMHGDFGKPDIADLGDCWKCNRCGLVAKKTIIEGV